MTVMPDTLMSRILTYRSLADNPNASEAFLRAEGEVAMERAKHTYPAHFNQILRWATKNERPLLVGNAFGRAIVAAVEDAEERLQNQQAPGILYCLLDPNSDLRAGRPGEQNVFPSSFKEAERSEEEVLASMPDIADLDERIGEWVRWQNSGDIGTYEPVFKIGCCEYTVKRVA